MSKLISLLAVVGIVGGVSTLCWYETLCDSEKASADEIAGRYAREMFGRTLDKLSSPEACRVQVLTKRHFAN